MWMVAFSVWFIGIFVFFFLEAATNPAPTEPVGSKNWFSTSVSVWVVCFLCVSVCSISAQPFCWEIGTVQLQL